MRAGHEPAAAIAGALALLGWAAAAAPPPTPPTGSSASSSSISRDAAWASRRWSVINDGAPLPDAFRTAGKWKRGDAALQRAPALACAGGCGSERQAPVAQLICQVQNGERAHAHRPPQRERRRPRRLIAPEDAQIRRPVSPASSARSTTKASGKSLHRLLRPELRRAGRCELGDRQSHAESQMLVVGSQFGLPPQGRRCWPRARNSRVRNIRPTRRSRFDAHQALTDSLNFVL